MSKIEFSNPYTLGNSYKNTTFIEPLHTLLRPYNIAGQHFNLVGEHFAKGNYSQMLKNAVIGSLELIPIINVIVAMVDRYFNEEVKSLELNLDFMDVLQTIPLEIDMENRGAQVRNNRLRDLGLGVNLPNTDQIYAPLNNAINSIEQAPNYEENHSFQLTNNGEVIGYRIFHRKEATEGPGIQKASFYLVRMNGQIYHCTKYSITRPSRGGTSFFMMHSGKSMSVISPDTLQRFGVTAEDSVKEVFNKLLNNKADFGFKTQEILDDYFSKPALNQTLHVHTKLPHELIDIVVAHQK